MESIQIIEAVDVEHFATGKVLIEEYAAALGVDLCFQNFYEEIEGVAKVYRAPRGCLLLAQKDGKSAGCVAVRGIEETVCEMKRLYVKPQYRGVGIGRLLVKTAIVRARQFHYSRIALDTLPSMIEARFLYESLGFREIKGYYQNPLHGVRYLELVLVAQ